MEMIGSKKKKKKLSKPILYVILIIVAVIQIFPLIWLLDFHWRAVLKCLPTDFW